MYSLLVFILIEFLLDDLEHANASTSDVLGGTDDLHDLQLNYLVCEYFCPKLDLFFSLRYFSFSLSVWYKSTRYPFSLMTNCRMQSLHVLCYCIHPHLLSMSIPGALVRIDGDASLSVLRHFLDIRAARADDRTHVTGVHNQTQGQFLSLVTILSE